MLRFIVRRLIQMIGVVVVLSLLLFMWFKALPGGTVSAMLGERATPERRVQLEQALGLDQPLWVQYWSYIKRIATGQFGPSNGVLPGRDAFEVFLSRFPATIELATLAILLAVLIGIPLGYFAARRRDSWVDNLSVMGSLIGVAVPVFFLAFMLKHWFAVELQWLPVSGRQDPALDATRVTGFFVLDGILTQEWDAAWDAFRHLLLPAFALASIPFAVIFRITRASVLDVVEEDYVRTANAKGLTSRIIRGRHILRNALLPVVTTIGLQTGALLAGAVLTERVFSFTGIGQALAIAIELKDYPVLQVLIMAAAAVYVVVNLLVDITYAIIDPRIRTR
ncbi:ABC transporter permease [Intrasporangium calvum]|uniref:Binding-protein-dependent transport systems inner membrane component n=1 Tax=Intrasporangium calvum (strain ATCC 23552 / DSM 43043 / JCM 3097 / NBRC 12989 / NCIMB 10167 / NRRL B-3866 / 7 KIP) TaxID=710696 RepID=E6S8F9_INTC7|nr:ABC transporter permease [Intrasporangium calvum]ADU49121.1 binding-protein-dependent transport systems inner membrane component [Intrasporangium calvum DSM 43043]AXG14069.1 ABC transporter permease [Intrasporangium calvum]